MKDVVFGFSYPKKFKIGAAAISWWMGRPYSHTYIRYTDSQGRDIIFHAAHGTVHPILVSNFDLDNNRVAEYVINFSEGEYNQLRDIYYEKSGQLYATRQIGLIPMYDILWKSFKYTLKSDNVPGYICSELVGHSLEKIKGYTFDRPLNLLRPDHIEDALIKDIKLPRIA